MGTFTVPFKRALELDPSIETDILANYPIFNEGYRDHLNEQIRDQFWNREIGQETVSMFKLALKRKLNQIMPLYNQHYELSRIKIDPLQTMSVKNIMSNTATTENESTSNTDSSSSSDAKAVASEYPQSALDGAKFYASSGQESESKSIAKGANQDASTSKQAETRDGTVTGSQGQAAMLIYQARQALVNVDAMVLNELETLFMLIWDNGDSYTNKGHWYELH